MTEAIAANPLVQALGLTLLDFVWQGAIAGVLTAIALVVLRRTTAHVRYLVACVGLAAMPASAVITFAGYLRERPLVAGHIVVTSTARPAPLSMPSSADRGIAASSDLAAASVFERQLPVLVVIWTAGVLVLTMRLLLGWRRVGRLRRLTFPISTGDLTATVERIAARLGVSQPVQLLKTASIDVPAVIGWLRPAIVLPASALAGLTPAHLEAILAHELAHVRRADYLINVLQSIVEILFFYHPAVWWVSGRIRLEREHCCDDIAAELCSDRVTYARALASLEELRNRRPSLAMGAGGGELLDRIRRLIDPKVAPAPRISGGLAMCVLLTVLLLAVSGQINGMSVAEPHPLSADVAQINPARATVAQQQPPTGVHPEPRIAITVPEPRRKPAPGPPATAVAPAATTLVAGADQGARLSGVVTDPSGGVIPGARVTVTAPSIAGAHQTTTDASGRFNVINLPPCDCRIEVSIPGFKTSSATIALNENQAFTVSIRLQLGSLSEMVTVRGGAPSSGQTGATSVVPSTLRTSTDYYDAARAYYQQGRLADAEAMTMRAVELLQIEMPDPAPVGAQDSVVVRVGGNIAEPRKIRHVPPIYPADAQAAGADGTVVIQAIIAKNGSVKDARVVQSIPQLDAAAVGAVRQWLFTPTLLNNVPVEVLMTVTVKFER
jgi:TonB family protein